MSGARGGAWAGRAVSARLSLPATLSSPIIAVIPLLLVEITLFRMGTPKLPLFRRVRCGDLVHVLARAFGPRCDGLMIGDLPAGENPSLPSARGRFATDLAKRTLGPLAVVSGR
jgi:hypothetical protein